MKKKFNIILFIVCLIGLYAGLIYKSLTFPKSLSSYSQKLGVPKKEYGSTPISIMKDFPKEEITKQGDNYKNKYPYGFKRDSKYIYNEINEFFDDGEISLLYDYQQFQNIGARCSNSLEIDLDRISKVLIPRITKTIKMPLKSELPSWESMSKLPLEPNIRDSVNYWLCMACILETQGRDMESLLVAFGLFYAAKELEDSFFNPNASKIMSKFSASSINKKAAKYILHWCSIPRLRHKNKVKELALKLIDIIKSDYKLSDYVEISEHELKRENLKFGEAAGWYADLVVNSNTFQKINDELHNNVKNYIDNSFPDSYKKIKDQIELIQEEPKNIIYELLLSPLGFSCKFIIMAETPNWASAKERIETNINVMAFAANALAINAYYSAYRELPESLEKLENWMGTELPKDRFTVDRFTYNRRDKDILRSEGAQTYIDNYIKFNFNVNH